MAPAFEETNRVITFDYIGAGDSDRSAYDPRRYSSLAGYADDILEICRALDLRDAILVGHSVSATIVMLASIAEPARFRDLILVTPSPRYLDDLPGYRGGFSRSDIDGLLGMMDLNAMGWAEVLAPVVMGNPDQPQLTRELETTFCSIDPVMAREFARITFLGDNRDDLAAVTTPALIIQCSADAVAPPEVGAYLHGHLVGSRLTTIEASGHCPHVSHPTETIAAIHAYLVERRRDPAPG